MPFYPLLLVDSAQATYLVRGPLDVQLLYRGLSQDAEGCGAIATFSGIIRPDSPNGSAVTEIEYSAYGGMAEKIFLEIEQEVLIQFEPKKILIRHSIGTVPAGEASMWIGVASKHRAAAFDALRAATELIKAKAPVWKKEHFKDGSTRWVETDWQDSE